MPLAARHLSARCPPANSPEGVGASRYLVWFCPHHDIRVEMACRYARRKLSRTPAVLSKLQGFCILSNVSKGTGSAELPAPSAPTSYCRGFSCTVFLQNEGCTT